MPVPRGVAAATIVWFASVAAAQDEPKPPAPPPPEAPKPPEPAPPPPPPARRLFEGTEDDLAAKFPNVSVREIGRSRGGRPLRLVTVLPKDAAETDIDWTALLV